MKKLIILFSILLVVICGCQQKEKEKEKVIENNGMLEIREDMPLKVIYQRRWIYGADKESSDPELILLLLQQIRDIKIGESTTMGVTDYTDIVIFEYEDGERMSYKFEADIYVKQEKERYIVTDGLQNLRATLEYMLKQK